MTCSYGRENEYAMLVIFVGRGKRGVMGISLVLHASPRLQPVTLRAPQTGCNMIQLPLVTKTTNLAPQISWLMGRNLPA